MIRKLLGIALVILLLFGVCATLEKETSPDGTAKETEAIWEMAIHSLGESFGQIKDGIVGIFKAVTSDDDSSDIATEIGEVSADDLPDEAQEYYRRYVDENWETRTKDLEGKTEAGKKYKNNSKVLPEKDAVGNDILYREYDAETTPKGSKRGKKRFVHGNDDSTYYTDDHYDTFKKVLN